MDFARLMWISGLVPLWAVCCLGCSLSRAPISHEMHVLNNCSEEIWVGVLPPANHATLVEITFDGAGGQDYYDVSLVDGYNLEVSIFPTPGRHDTTHKGPYYCARAGCNTDMNQQCPAELEVVISGDTVACKSACLAFDTDEYCCRGAYNTAQTCPDSSYAQVFKKACPNAYSYAFDDQHSTFTCKGKGGPSSYEIVFC